MYRMRSWKHIPSVEEELTDNLKAIIHNARQTGLEVVRGAAMTAVKGRARFGDAGAGRYSMLQPRRKENESLTLLIAPLKIPDWGEYLKREEDNGNYSGRPADRILYRCHM